MIIQRYLKGVLSVTDEFKIHIIKEDYMFSIEDDFGNIVIGVQWQKGSIYLRNLNNNYFHNYGSHIEAAGKEILKLGLRSIKEEEEFKKWYKRVLKREM